MLGTATANPDTPPSPRDRATIREVCPSSGLVELASGTGHLDLPVSRSIFHKPRN